MMLHQERNVPSTIALGGAHMAIRFIGRQSELAVLENAYGSAGSAFIPIYGRRRVGKSELILQFIRNKPGLYFLGKRAPGGLQIREFLQAASVALNEPLLAELSPRNWTDALRVISERWKGPGKIVIVLDEFQWTADANPELPSVLQEFWDRQWAASGKVVLILCGSFVGFMERAVLGKKSPLYGRRTAQILLKPFGYRESAQFHPSFSLEDRARTYFICGGIPPYLNCFSTDRSVEINIAANFLNEFATLYREPDFLLREELRDIENYYGILLAIATGNATNHAISKQTGIGERSLHYYLKQLTELGYLGRRYPLTGEQPSLRHVRYAIEDPMLRFWFRFVYPHTSFIQQMGSQRALKDLVRPDLEAYFGSCFERLCRETLPHLYEREGVTAPFDVGEYWDKETQIDVVGYRRDGWTDLGECKWGDVKSGRRLLDELEARVARYPNPRNATIGRRIFTRKALTGEGRASGSPVRCHSLRDLYAE